MFFLKVNTEYFVEYYRGVVLSEEKKERMIFKDFQTAFKFKLMLESFGYKLEVMKVKQSKIQLKYESKKVY